MPAYIVAMMSIHDADRYKQYTDKTPPLVKKHGGRFLTRGQDVSCFEGTSYDGRLVILEFPDRAHVKAWFADPEYCEAKAHRQAASKMNLLMLQEGGSNTENPDPKL
ncbi:DUF1330 domain-containing protein [Ruegeria litorea]|uniref:DUF1330 domain-containing protein n=1 Tax=Falsiruegeria litorea TaxID=1280831 RepID=A0ABS5WK41_9RHOB|nr:DUF1330 domain-containing protein [Falsiruegeria litorea]MBT3139490.1 DUF1330 domain-containing protein [Falsiruegeria litorea]